MNNDYGKASFSMILNSGALNPADNQTYFTFPNVTFGLYNIIFTGWSVPRPILITDLVLTKHVNGTQGSLEPSEFGIGLVRPVPGQTNYAFPAQAPQYYGHKKITDTVYFNDAYYPTQVFNNLKILLLPGDMYAFRWKTPTFATNPTSVYLWLQLHGQYVEMNQN